LRPTPKAWRSAGDSIPSAWLIVVDFLFAVQVKIFCPIEFCPPEQMMAQWTNVEGHYPSARILPSLMLPAGFFSQLSQNYLSLIPLLHNNFAFINVSKFANEPSL
jgi:hypothetical protein